jgi:hypothetical protein
VHAISVDEAAKVPQLGLATAQLRRLQSFRRLLC